MKRFSVAIIALVTLAACMAQARQLRHTYGYTDTENSVTFQKSSVSYTATGKHEQGEVVTVATNETLFGINASLTGGEGPGLVLFHNEGDATGTNTTVQISIGITAGSYFMTIPYGCGSIGWLDSSVTGLFFKASNTNALIRVKAFER